MGLWSARDKVIFIDLIGDWLNSKIAYVSINHPVAQAKTFS